MGLAWKGARSTYMSLNIVGIGELLWDLLPSGPQLGGAPANFAVHAAALGANSCLISRVGQDAEGQEAARVLNELGVRTDCLEVDPFLPTGSVSVEVAADGQPRFTIHENVAWDNLAGGEEARGTIAFADAVCFGTLGQRSENSRKSIRTLLASLPPIALRILDLNLRAPFYSPELILESLTLANVLKLNEAELQLVGRQLGLAGDYREQIVLLAENFRLKCVACTRGERGSILFSGGIWSDQPGTPVRVVDAVGAGDAFTAVMTVGLLSGVPVDLINRHATEVAAYVCSQAGATPKLPEELRTFPINHL